MCSDPSPHRAAALHRALAETLSAAQRVANDWSTLRPQSSVCLPRGVCCGSSSYIAAPFLPRVLRPSDARARRAPKPECTTLCRAQLDSVLPQGGGVHRRPAGYCIPLASKLDPRHDPTLGAGWKRTPQIPRAHMQRQLCLRWRRDRAAPAVQEHMATFGQRARCKACTSNQREDVSAWMGAVRIEPQTCRVTRTRAEVCGQPLTIHF